MKKIKSLRIALVLFVATMVSSHIYCGTLAKYVTTASGEDSARVAKWGIDLSIDGNLFGDSYNENKVVSNADMISVSVENINDLSGNDNIVAPGTGNSTGITVKISGKSVLSNSGIELFNCLNDAEIPFLVLNTLTLYLV